jgi:DNA-binding transcriptional regulator YiaG
MRPSDLTNIRTEFDLSQSQLARLLGVSRNTIASWEIGRNPISKAMEKAIIHVTKCETELVKMRKRAEDQRHEKQPLHEAKRILPAASE